MLTIVRTLIPHNINNIGLFLVLTKDNRQSNDSRVLDDREPYVVLKADVEEVSPDAEAGQDLPHRHQEPEQNQATLPFIDTF